MVKCMTVEVKLDKEQLEEIVAQAIDNFKKELCADCPYRDSKEVEYDN